MLEPGLGVSGLQTGFSSPTESQGRPTELTETETVSPDFSRGNVPAGRFAELAGIFYILSGQWSGQNSPDGLVGVGEVSSRHLYCYHAVSQISL